MTLCTRVCIKLNDCAAYTAFVLRFNDALQATSIRVSVQSIASLVSIGSCILCKKFFFRWWRRGAWGMGARERVGAKEVKRMFAKCAFGHRRRMANGGSERTCRGLNAPAIHTHSGKQIINHFHRTVSTKCSFIKFRALNAQSRQHILHNNTTHTPAEQYNSTISFTSRWTAGHRNFSVRFYLSRCVLSAAWHTY